MRPRLRTRPRSLVALATLTGALAASLATTANAQVASPRPGPRTTGVDAEIVVGPTYEIKEPSLLAELLKRVAADQASGAMQRRMDEGKTRALESMRNPAPNDSIGRAAAARTWYYDPTIVVTENITAEGRVIVRAGTRVNPLDKVNWSKLWLFIDARDPPQVSYAKRAVARLRGNTKVILTGGKLKETSLALGQQVYFDQGARLVARFGIAATPATVRQEGTRLRIDEVQVP